MWVYMKVKILILGLILSCAASFANEAEYRDQWAQDHGGQIEFTLPDQTSVDILTETHAIEVDYAKKSAEAIATLQLNDWQESWNCVNS